MLYFSEIYNSTYNIKNNIGGAITSVFRFLGAKMCLFFLLVVNIAQWLVVYLIFDRASEQLLVLHYNVDFGPDRMGQASQLYIMPAIGTAVLFLNVLLLLFFYRRGDIRALSRFLLGAALAVNIFILMALGPIYLINFVY